MLLLMLCVTWVNVTLPLGLQSVSLREGPDRMGRVKGFNSGGLNFISRLGTVGLAVDLALIYSGILTFLID